MIEAAGPVAILASCLTKWSVPLPGNAMRAHLYGQRKINFSSVFAGQIVSIREIDDKIWLVSFVPMIQDSSMNKTSGSNRPLTHLYRKHVNHLPVRTH